MNILRLLRGEDESDLALEAAALLVRRAGLEHLIDDATGAEVAAMVQAGNEIIKEQAVVFAATLLDPAHAFVPYDSGKALRAATKRAAFALSEGANG